MLAEIVILLTLTSLKTIISTRVYLIHEVLSDSLQACAIVVSTFAFVVWCGSACI